MSLFLPFFYFNIDLKKQDLKIGKCQLFLFKVFHNGVPPKKVLYWRKFTIMKERKIIIIDNQLFVISEYKFLFLYLTYIHFVPQPYQMGFPVLNKNKTFDIEIAFYKNENLDN